MRLMEKKAGLILGGILLFSLVLVGFVMAATSIPTTATVTVKEFLSVTLSDTPVAFPEMDPGQTLSATAGTGFPLKATVGPESNVNADVGTKANNESFGSVGVGNFLVSNMEWATDSGFTPPFDYTTNDATVCSGKGAGETCNIFHRLTIPSNQPAGIYTVGVTVSAIKTP